jgi:hypothetical protein
VARVASIRVPTCVDRVCPLKELIYLASFGGYTKQRLRSESGKKLSKKNVKFLLGLARLLLGDQGAGMLSLDLLAMPQFIKLIDSIFRQRKQKGQRKYVFFLNALLHACIRSVSN